MMTVSSTRRTRGEPSGHSRRWWLLLCALLTSVAMLASACGDDGDDAAAGDNGGEGSGDTSGSDGELQPQFGGTLTMAMYSEARGLDPIQNSGTGVAGGTELAALYDTIMRWNPDTHEFETRTAESLEHNEDHTEWTLVLQPGITFRDGAPYDAEAVKLSFERHASAQNRVNASRTHVQAVQSVEVVDPLTVKFTLSSSWPGFPYLLADEPGMLVSPKAIAALGDPEAPGYQQKLTDFGLNPVGAGAGPFEIVSFAPQEAIVMKKNPNYWGGDVYLDELRFVVLAGADATFEAVKADSVQAGFIRNPEVVAAAKEDGFEGFEYLVQAGDVLLINNGLPVTCQDGQPAPACTDQADGTQVPADTPGADVRVRQAIAHALDPTQLAERAYDGEGRPGNALVLEDYPYYPGVEGPQYDPDRARQLVEQAKAAGWDGSIRITCTNSPERQAVALGVEAMLESVGMDVTVRSDIDVATQIGEVIVRKDFDLACWGINIYPDEGAALQLEQNLGGSSPTNRVGYESAEFDQALADFKAGATDEEKTAAMERLSSIYNEDVPVISFGAIPEFVVWRPEVHGVVTTQVTMVLLDEAWIEQ